MNGKPGKTIGIIGGLGPDTTAEFYRMLIGRARTRFSESYPRVLIHSIPVPFAVERNIVRHGRGEEEMLPLLREGVRRLEASGADLITIPCNTVHLFHRELQGLVEVPLLNILDETAAVCSDCGFARVGVLGTGKTIETRLYQSALEDYGVEPVVPEPPGQQAVSDLIYRILGGESPAEPLRKELAGHIGRLVDEGAEAVILGCTDLQHLVAVPEVGTVPEADPASAGTGAVPEAAIAVSAVVEDRGLSAVPLVDSLEALARASVREMAEKKHKVSSITKEEPER